MSTFAMFTFNNMNVVFYDSPCYETHDVLILNYHLFVYREASFDCCLSMCRSTEVTFSLPAMPFYGRWTFASEKESTRSLVTSKLCRSLQSAVCSGLHQVCESENIITCVSSNHFGRKTHVHIFMNDKFFNLLLGHGIHKLPHA